MLKEFVPFQAPSATYEADGVTYNLLIVEGKPTWVQQRDGGSLGATARSWGELLRKRTRQRR